MHQQSRSHEASRKKQAAPIPQKVTPLQTTDDIIMARLSDNGKQHNNTDAWQCAASAIMCAGESHTCEECFKPSTACPQTCGKRSRAPSLQLPLEMVLLADASQVSRTLDVKSTRVWVRRGS